MSKTARVSHLLVVCGTVASCWGLWTMRNLDDFEAGIWAFVAAIAAAAVAGCVELSMESTIYGGRLWPSIRRTVGYLAIPLLFGMAIYPATAQHGESLDPTWFFVVPMLVLLGGSVVILLVTITWAMVLMPMMVLCTRLVPALRGDDASRLQVLLALLLLDVVGFGIAARVASGGGLRDGGFPHALLVSTAPAAWILRLTVLVVAVIIPCTYRGVLVTVLSPAAMERPRLV